MRRIVGLVNLNDGGWYCTVLGCKVLTSQSIDANTWFVVVLYIWYVTAFGEMFVRVYPWIIQGLTFLSAWKTQCINNYKYLLHVVQVDAFVLFLKYLWVGYFCSISLVYLVHCGWYKCSSWTEGFTVKQYLLWTTCTGHHWLITLWTMIGAN